MPLPLLEQLDTAVPEVASLLELLGLCGRRGMGKTVLGQVLIPEVFLRELATPLAVKRTYNANHMQSGCTAGLSLSVKQAHLRLSQIVPRLLFAPNGSETVASVK